MVKSSAPHNEDSFNYFKIIKVVINSYLALFIFYLTYLIHTKGQEETIIIYRNIRDVSYKVVAMFFVAVGLWIMLKGRKVGTKPTFIPKIIPLTVMTLIIITFSYGFADLLYKTLELFNLL